MAHAITYRIAVGPHKGQQAFTLQTIPQGLIRYAMKTPWKNGTTHLLFEPLDLIARLAALVPKPRINRIRYHGVFAPNSSLRAQVTPARCGRRPADEIEIRTPAERHAAMSLKRSD